MTFLRTQVVGNSESLKGETTIDKDALKRLDLGKIRSVTKFSLCNLTGSGCSPTLNPVTGSRWILLELPLVG